MAGGLEEGAAAILVAGGQRVVTFLLELVPALLLGLLVGRRWPGLAARLAPPLVQWGVPFSLAGLLLRSGMHWRFGQMALLTLLLVSLGLLLVRRCFRDPVHQLGAVVGNTAYFGLPAALALLPSEAVGYAISYDLAATLFTWALGPLLLTGRALRMTAVLQELVRSPASRGLLVAGALQLTPWRLQLASWLWWPARVVVLASLVLVGMRLASAGTHRLPRQLWPVLAGKLLLFPLALLPVALGLALPQPAAAALVLQAAAPTAVSVLLLAEARPQQAGDGTDAAALVFWSTLLALGTVPLWARLLTLVQLNPPGAGV
jgi:predicted permease